MPPRLRPTFAARMETDDADVEPAESRRKASATWRSGRHLDSAPLALISGRKRDLERAVDRVTNVLQELLDELVTAAPTKDREVETAKARARAQQRFGVAV